jgi:hypothetical protein
MSLSSGKKSKIMGGIAFILIIASLHSAYMAYDDYSTAKANAQYLIEKRDQRTKLADVGKKLIIKHYADVEAKGNSIANDTLNGNLYIKNASTKDFDIVVSDITPTDINNPNGFGNIVTLTYTLNYKSKKLSPLNSTDSVDKVTNITQDMTCYITTDTPSKKPVIKGIKKN